MPKINKNANILSLIDNTPSSLMKAVAANVRSRRLGRNWTQKLLAAKAGIPLSTYRLFESKGEISLRSLAMLSIILDETENLSNLFSKPEYQSIDELMDANASYERQRGRKK
jgi:transcriptional regulator with XRE-family HTH domain